MLPDLKAPVVPAPWTLSGEGFIFLYCFAPNFLRQQGFISPSLLPHFRGGPSVVMLVDYDSSDAGPYRELLFIPGRFRLRGRSYFSISKIYVSTAVSVVSGWHNWGIPKELAEFAWEKRNGRSQVRVSAEGKPIASFELETKGIKLPFSTGVVPHGLRTLCHLFDKHTFLTTLTGRGVVCWATLNEVEVDGANFPDLTQGRLLTAVQASQFTLRFPEPSFLD